MEIKYPDQSEPVRGEFYDSQALMMMVRFLQGADRYVWIDGKEYPLKDEIHLLAEFLGITAVFRKAAEDGNVEAQYVFGLHYASGEDKVEWMHKAAEQGHRESQFHLGEFYLDMGWSWGAPHFRRGNDEEAMKWLLMAKKQGHKAAAQLLKELLQRIAEAKVLAARRQAEVEAAAAFRKAADAGDADAQINLGACYYEGRGVPKNKAEAVEWYRKAAHQFGEAAHQGDVEAQYRLGECFLKGIGMPQRDVKAVEWLRKAKEGGHKKAGQLLKMALQRIADTEAFPAILQSAEEGDAEAQYKLAECFANGQGVPRKVVEAAKWYRKAAEQGHAEACFKICRCYINGSGVPKRIAEQFKWLEKVAELGHAGTRTLIVEMGYTDWQIKEVLRTLPKPVNGGILGRASKLTHLISLAWGWLKMKLKR